MSAIFIYPYVEAPALVSSQNDSAISATVSGLITNIPAKVGDMVSQGEILVQIDAGDLEQEKKRLDIALTRASKQKASAETDLSRKRQLGGNVSKAELKQAETQLAVVSLDYQDIYAQLEMAISKIHRATIRAPFTGIVTQRLGQIGEFVSPGKPLVQIVDVENIDVSANVQTKDVQSLEKAQEIDFLYDLEVFPLKVRAVVNVRNQKTRTQEVRLSFLKKEQLPGTAGRLRWRHTQPHIPPELLVRRGSKLGIFILKDKKAFFMPMEGALEGRPMPTTMAPETLIVVKGRNSLQHGQVIEK